MSKIIAGLLCVCFLSFVAAGCQKDEKEMSGQDTTMRSSTAGDACPHCAGKQAAKADGTCPICGMKVSGGGNAMKMQSGGSTTKPATRPSADACPHCPGDQAAKANGTCPVCGMKVKG